MAKLMEICQATQYLYPQMVLPLQLVQDIMLVTVKVVDMCEYSKYLAVFGHKKEQISMANQISTSLAFLFHFHLTVQLSQ